MDFKKFAQIVVKDIRGLLADRTALVITIAAPLAITAIMGLAFGGSNMGGTAARNIPVVIVNRDQGSPFANLGKILTDNFVKPPEGLKDLISAEELTDEAAAKDRVRTGKAAAAIFIPPDFSQSLNPANPTFGDTKMTLQLYRDAGSPISADIVKSVIQQFLNQFANADIAVYAGSKVNPLLLLQASSIAQDAAQASSQSLIKLETTQSASSASQGQSINLLAYFAPSLAVFFLNFLASSGASTILEEQDNGTLQRLLTTPTSRITILAGKLGGTYVNGVLQVAVLIIATSVVGVMMGSSTPVWGTNYPALLLLLLVVVAGATGLGTLIAGAARTSQQVGVYGNALYILMGIAGGTFFVLPSEGPFAVLSKLTINYWASNGFYKLTQTGDLTSVLPNMAVLLGIFVVCFGIGAVLFNRRLKA